MGIDAQHVRQRKQVLSGEVSGLGFSQLDPLDLADIDTRALGQLLLRQTSFDPLIGQPGCGGYLSYMDGVPHLLGVLDGIQTH